MNIINRLVYQLFRPLVNYKLSIKEDARLSKKEVALTASHLANLKVVPDREALLNHLPKGGTVVEVGVAEGEFSDMILKTTLPDKLVLVDLWDSPSPMYGPEALCAIESRHADSISAERIEIRRGTSWDQLSLLPKESVDWLYLDAAHDYDSVKKDLEASLVSLRPNGLICGHDYIRWARGPARYGVVEAVGEFMLDRGFEMLYMTHEQNQHLSFAIRRMKTS
jgi:hypothetical protein